ncbi:MAG: hypothetical protein JNJ77_02475 [Planctomycetia bacterium]|nr:hypothetical protein [Planctomycetia bacterium]
MAGLARKLDAEVAKAGKGKLNAVVIFTSDEDDMKDKIEKFKTDNKLKNIHLGLDGSKGPEGYNLSKDASVTALLYVKRKVQKNHAFEKFATSDIDAVVKDFSNLNAAPEKK